MRCYHGNDIDTLFIDGQICKIFVAKDDFSQKCSKQIDNGLFYYFHTLIQIFVFEFAYMI